MPWGVSSLSPSHQIPSAASESPNPSSPFRSPISFKFSLTHLLVDSPQPLLSTFLAQTIFSSHFPSTILPKVKVKSLSHVQLFVTPRAVAYEVPPSMEFSRQEYWSVLPFASSGDLPNPGIEFGSATLQADAFTVWATRDSILPKQKFKKIMAPFISLSAYLHHLRAWEEGMGRLVWIG